MTDISAIGTATPAPARLGGIGRTLRLGAIRAGYEVRMYLRESDSVFFTFLFPSLMFVVFASAFSSQGKIGVSPGHAGISVAAYYLPGLVAAGIVLSGIQNLGIQVATERSDGSLKRLGGSPLPVTSYLLGKIGMSFVTAIAQLVLLLAVAHFAFAVDLPDTWAQWGRFAWIFLLSMVTAVVLGFGISGVPRSGRTASAVIVPVLLVLQFISGVYFQFTALPTWLQNIASVFPLKWVAQGMRSVFLPGYFETAERGGSWDLGTMALVLAGWAVVGLVVALRTFRWVKKDG